MRKTYMGLIVGMLVATLLLPSIAAVPTFGNKKDVFKDCYIEASGAVESTGSSFIKYVMWKHFWFRPYGDDRAFVLLWRIAFMEPEVTVTIYTEKNGDVLWQDTGLAGIWGLTLFWFNGIYTNDGTTEDQLIINFQGTVKVAIVYTEK
jgi:hypothetical protein